MMLSPCPLCGKAPNVEVHRNDLGKVWTVSCKCYVIHSYNQERLVMLWATHCVKMAEEAGE